LFQLLDLANDAKRGQRVLNHRVTELGWIDMTPAAEQAIHLLLPLEFENIGRQQITALLHDSIQGSGDHAAILADIETGKMQTEQAYLASERLQLVEVQPLVILDEHLFDDIQLRQQ